MSIRTSLILLVLLVLVAGSLVFSQFRPSPPPDDAIPENIGVIAVSPNDLHRVTISYRESTQVFFKKGDYWHFDDVYETPVDNDRWGGIVPLLSGPVSRRLLLETTEALSPFGLDDPQVRLSVELTANRGFEYLLGNKTEDGVSHYVKLQESPLVYLVDSTWGDVLTRLIVDKPYPKWYYQASSEQVSELRVDYQGNNVSFIRDAKRGWQVNTSSRADERPLVDDQRWEQEVMPHLSGPPMQYQVEPELKDPSKYGLDEPIAMIHIEFGKFQDGGLEVFYDREWMIGSKTDDGAAYYAKLFGFPPVVAVDTTWVDALLEISNSPPYDESAA